MDTFKPQKILVTGSAGFIGSNFIHFILDVDPSINIISLDKLTYAGNKKNLEHLPDDSRHLFIHGDICDRDLLSNILCEHDIDTIAHFAAESHVDRSIATPANFIQTNIVGTFTLLETARTYWQEEKKLASQQYRFHHISSDEVYGTLNALDVAVKEDAPYKPNSPYSATKA